MDALQRAIASIDRDDEDAALDVLLAAWAARRAASLAAVIDRYDAFVARRRPPPPTGGAGKVDAWVAAFDAAPIGSQSPLFDGVTDSVVAAATARLRRLGSRPPDPRLAARLWTWLSKVPYPGKAARAFYVEVARQLVAIDDDRWDEAIVAELEGNHTTGHYAVARLRRVGARTGVKALKDLAAHVHARGPHPVDAAYEAAIAEVDDAVTAAIRRGEGELASEESLLAAIYADPAADAPRSVYADFLQERGDPRGELVALQLARASSGEAPSRREASLVKRYQDALIGELSPFVLKSGREFRRGLLACCRYKDERVGRHSIGLAAWATVEEVDVSPHVFASGAYPLVTQPHMRVLRVVRGMTGEDLAKLCVHDSPLPIEEIHLRRADIASLVEPLRHTDALPKLRRLDLRDVRPRSDVDLLRSALEDRVEVL